MKHEAIDRGDKIAHDRDLEVSYGRHVPQPSTVKGHIDAFGELAGSTDSAMSLVPKRDITFDDSINDNRHNQPKSH
jgi:hypothetical protein